MYQWLKKANDEKKLSSLPKPEIPGLPDPNSLNDESDQSACIAANAEIETELENVPPCTPSPGSRKRKRGNYVSYSDENRAKIARYAIENGNSKAAKYFSEKQITGVLGCTASGNFLPLQVIYQGLTDQCHARFNFPKDWNITHSETHWSTSETMMEYVKNIIIPYVEHTRDTRDLPLRQTALVILDVFKAHTC